MSDIFDEVDEILNEVDGDADVSPEAAIAAESNFNESELMDIMAEIENLEKEFVADEAISNDMEETIEDTVVETVAHKESLQEAIDRELAMSLEASAEADVVVEEEVEVEEIIVAPASVQSVLAFEKKVVTPVPVTASSSSEISFQANGQMNLNLGFKIGEETAALTIDPVNGLTVTMNGVVLSINDAIGCHVTMENGVTFTIPLTSASTNLKKKSA